MGFLIGTGYSKSTAEVEERNRFDYWRQAICDEFVKLDCDRKDSGDFSGEVRGGVALSSLHFSEVAADSQIVKRSKSQIAKSVDDDFLISFQIASTGLVAQNGREAVLTPGSFALYDSTQPYTLSFNEHFHQFVLQMPKTVLSQHLMNPEQYTAISISGGSGLGAILQNFIFSLVKEIQGSGNPPIELTDNLVNMIAMAFSSTVMLEQVGDSSVIHESLKRRIRQYITNNLGNPELSNNRIAGAQGISVRYLHKLFQHENETLHNEILHKRLEKSLQLLRDPSYAGHSIERIGYNVGFSSAAHFSRSFKKHFGNTPSEVRS